ncbi:Ig-like domain-containing protein, partial [Rhizobiaceae sp. 2RAB30]
NITGGAPTSVAVATQATNGTATANGTSITYTPDTGYSGPDSFTYTATNADGTSMPATVTITVNPQPPTAGAASATVAFGSSNNPITLALGGGTPTSVAVAGGAANGTATASGTTISYTPDTGYSGPDSFTYTATNTGGTSAPATVTITVNPAAPVANAVSATVAANSSGNPITLNITGGAPASVTTPTLPTNGTVSVVGTGITYTPTAGYSGNDSFTYTATNATATSTPATVSITVTPPTLSLAAIATSGVATTSYSATIVASLGTAPYDFERSSGTLPPGLTLQGDGTLAGTPTTPGSFTFVVTATDTHNATGTQSYTIDIAAPTISITAPAAGALPGVVGGGTYNQTFTATGGAGARQFTVTGTLPPGLAFSGSVLSGT